MKKLLHRQDGVAMVLVLIILAMSVPIVGAGLGLASSLSVDSSIKTRILEDQYCSLGGDEHALYTITNDDTFMDTIADGESATYTISCNGEEITITVFKESTPADWEDPTGDDTRRLTVDKSVVPTTALKNVTTIFTYTIEITNQDDDPEVLTTVFDDLPEGFDYVLGTTSGITTSDPTDNLGLLEWDVTGENITIQPGESATLVFNASARFNRGENFCNEAWVNPGGTATSSGRTAMVTADGSNETDCTGMIAKVRKKVMPPSIKAHTPTTFDYTITVQSKGRSVLTILEFNDLLPEGFSYVPGSSYISTLPYFAVGEPQVSTQNGREYLEWSFDPHRVLRYEKVELEFQASAVPEPGDYWNEAWVTMDGFESAHYTGPTARVKSLAVVKSEAKKDGITTKSEIWIGTEEFEVVETGITQ